MLRKSNREYTDRTSRPSVRERIESRFSKVFPDREETQNALFTALGSLTMEELINLAEQAISEFPNDQDAIHRLVDDLWATKQQVVQGQTEEFLTNIEKETTENDDFRRVLYTGKHIQLVLMSIPPGEDIGMEAHDLAQFVRIEQGEATLVVDGKEYKMEADSAAIIPEGSEHNVVNTGDVDLKIYTIYAPSEHPPETVQKTKEDSEK